MPFDQYWASYWTKTSQPAAFDAAIRDIAFKAWHGALASANDDSSFEQYWSKNWTPTAQPPVFDAAMREVAHKAWHCALAQQFIQSTAAMTPKQLDDWYEQNVGYRLSDDDIELKVDIAHHRSAVGEMMCLHKYGEGEVYQAYLSIAAAR